jgi:N-acetylglucosaminyldiphosphoundecaprenol N-acetyl-beta-D-mannosaminyltransferase
MMATTLPEAPVRLGRPLFGFQFDGDRLETLVSAVATMPAPGQGVRLLVTANLDHIVILRKNPALRRAYDHSWRRTIDGTPVWVYARMRGARVPERVTGADLVPELLPRLAPDQHRLFFVVATEEIGRRITAWAALRGYPVDAVITEVPPFGFERDEVFGMALARRIRDHGTTHLFFGVGCPRSETWIDGHRDQLGDLYALAVGAALGFFAGVERRAPPVVRRLGMEWLWRVHHEPRRLGPRYFVRSWAFFAAVAGDLRGRAPRG